ncbi:MAG: FAD:protein FMN transferase [Nitrospirae bacterium]|nr:FAD:protein FMN transferase [Nitrospirota bacterium]
MRLNHHHNSAPDAMKRILLQWIASLICLALFSSSCTPRLKIFDRSRYQMGTIVELTVVSSSEKKAEEAMTAGFAEIKRLEQLMSVYQETSEFSKINQMAGIQEVSVSPEVYDIIQKGLETGRLTEGGFNLAIGPAVKLWGVTESQHVPTPEELNQIRPLVNLDKIILNPQIHSVFLKDKGMKIDSGGIGKGYAADRVEKVLKRHGIEAGMVAMAGDVKVFGIKPNGLPWRVGIKHPRQPGKVLATIDLSNQAISTSGDYERFFIKDGIRYHHLLDPKTLQPARGCQSVSIIAGDGTMSDALSTGIFIMGPEKGMALIEKLPHIGGVIVDQNGKILISSNLKNKILIP